MPKSFGFAWPIARTFDYEAGSLNRDFTMRATVFEDCQKDNPVMIVVTVSTQAYISHSDMHQIVMSQLVAVQYSLKHVELPTSVVIGEDMIVMTIDRD